MSAGVTSQERWRAVRAVVEKDLRVATASKAVTLPLVIVPIIFVVLIPLGLGLAVRFTPAEGVGELISQVESFSPTLLRSLEGLEDAQKFLVLALVYMMAPLFLVLPTMVASVFAADSFAGEKERKTIEALIYSPISDRDLLLAKVLSGWLAAVAVGLLAFVVYCVTANLAAWPVMGRVFLPNWMWLVLVAWVMPAAAAVSLGATVLVSLRVSTFQEAYQIGGVVVLPIIALTVAQASGVMYLSVWLTVALGLVLWAVAALLLFVGGKRMTRSEILARV